MPEITIRYDDVSDACPHAALSAVIGAAARHLTVREIVWNRDDDLDEERAKPAPALGLSYEVPLGHVSLAPSFARGGIIRTSP